MANIGENVVIDNSGALNIIQQGIARSRAIAEQAQKQRQAEEDKLNEQLNKLSPKGLSQQDLPEFNAKVEKLHEAYYKYKSARTPHEARAAKMEVDNEWRDAFTSTSTAASARQRAVELAKTYASNREDYDDNVLKDVAAELAKPVSKIDFARIDPLLRERKVDEIKVNTSVMKDIQGLIDGTTVETKMVNLPGAAGMKGKTSVQNVRRVDDKSIATVLQSHYTASDDFKKLLKNRYGDKTADPVMQLSMYQADIPKEIYTKYDKPQVSTNQPIVVKTGGSGRSAADKATETAQTYTQQQVEGLMSGDPATAQRLAGVLSGSGKIMNQNDKLTVLKSGKFITIKVPQLVSSGTTPIPPKDYRIDTSTEKGRAELGAIYQRLTGEKVSPATLNTFKGRKIVGSKAPAVKLVPKTNPSPKKSSWDSLKGKRFMDASQGNIEIDIDVVRGQGTFTADDVNKWIKSGEVVEVTDKNKNLLKKNPHLEAIRRRSTSKPTAKSTGKKQVPGF